ncbi:peptidase M23 [Streptomyces sp. NPDC006656]|uniref:peptidase M23 n=1 Tax=Streptomyces sp. NPDC006656 TaxID=3156899 RepID=UPI003456F583
MVDARDAAEAAATTAAAPLLAKVGCIGAAVAVVGMLGLGITSLLAAGSAQEAAKNGQKRGCEAPGLPDPGDLGSVPPGILAQQIHHAKIIDQVAQERGLPGRGTRVALMTALQESGLINIDHGDRDSIGLFQQRPSQGWGSRAELMNPSHSSNLFYGGNPGRPPGLVDISGWNLMDPGAAAQAVQRSGHPELYATRHGQAEQIARKAGINLDRLGAVTGDTPAWRPDPSAGPVPQPCVPDGGPAGAPFHDAAAGWPPEVKNPRSTADAITWAKAQPARNEKKWWRACLAFSAIVYGWNASGVETAILHYQKMPPEMKHAGSRDVPPGALMYWDTGNPWGHVSVYLGDGLIISNDIRRPGYLDIVPAAEIESKWGAKYLGWAPPYFPQGS